MGRSNPHSTSPYTGRIKLGKNPCFLYYPLTLDRLRRSPQTPGMEPQGRHDKEAIAKRDEVNQ